MSGSGRYERTPEVRAKLRAAMARPEVRAKRSAAQRAAWARPEVRAKRSARDHAEPRGVRQACPRCRKRALVSDHGMSWCESCGHEPAGGKEA